MSSTFCFYSEERGVKWYRCKNCGALQRGTPPKICPVCEGKMIPKREETKE